MWGGIQAKHILNTSPKHYLISQLTQRVKFVFGNSHGASDITVFLNHNFVHITFITK
jgi:hypothetical protein